MGKINNIHLKNFRNFQDFKISFNSNCNILFGKNGSGKTNLLESISNLGKGRGFRNSGISNLIYKDPDSGKSGRVKIEKLSDGASSRVVIESKKSEGK